MNEKVLKSLTKLFAIMATADGSIDEAIEILEDYLTFTLHESNINKYIELFEHQARRNASNDEIREIATMAAEELTLRQRIVTIIELLELAYSNDVFSEEEQRIMKIICESYNIEFDRLHRMQQFLTTNKIEELAKIHNCLTISNDEEGYGGKRHLYKSNIKTPLSVLYMPLARMYFVKVCNQDQVYVLNGEKMTLNRCYALDVGGVIRIGGKVGSNLYHSEVSSVFVGIQNVDPISFEANNINYFFGKKHGLHDINIAEEGGNMVALMGASGSGKSTLLNVLNGTYKPKMGEVLINGIDIHKEPEKVKGVIGYVPQDDLLIEELTVYENLYFAAKLSFAKSTPEEVEKIIMRTIENLGLYSVKDLKVGNPLEKTISGGQRKRLNIGLELLREPSVMFVDEPTSGLSSQDSENVIDLLRQLTYSGKLIFVVIHQPSSDIYKMFDKLVVLDVGGYPVYYGNPITAVSYFKGEANYADIQSECQKCGNVDSEQVFEILESKVLDEYGRRTRKRKWKPELWWKKFKESIKLPQVERITSPPKNVLEIPSKINQFKIFVLRDLNTKFNNKQYMMVNLIQAPFLALMLSLIVYFYHFDELIYQADYVFRENMNMPSYIFMSVIVALFLGLMISAEELIKDRKIRKREVYLSLSNQSYLYSKVAILSGMSAVQVLVFVLIGNTIMGIRGLYLEYFLMLFSTACVANMIGLNVSSAFKNVVTVYILIPILLIPQLLLGGVVVQYDNINPIFKNKQGKVPMVGEFMASRWAFEGLMVEQFADNQFEKNFFPIDMEIYRSDYMRTYYFPTLLSKLEEMKVILHNKKADVSEEERKVAMKRFDENFLLLRNELHHNVDWDELDQTPNVSLDNLSSENFTLAIADQIYETITQGRQHFNMSYIYWKKKREEKVTELLDKFGKEKYLKYKDNYTNNRISEFVTNVMAEKRIVEYGHQLIQKIYPVYNLPTESSNTLDFRTHFFAPKKLFLGQYFNTFWFNIIVLWVMFAFMFVALYFRWLAKFIYWIEIKFANKDTIRT
ncbi:ATP-binding cassette domain-containing protein [Flammeovirga yaeyamensis]|uniref:ATP-binding cassette domain-containing protein n=1 Tax=Flammeovirga yaeyamensis TaxID=367791 RepID=A0AAX1N3D4_9BACT|nr:MULTISPECIES: ATP-binding cassette domain-containing protein [Flammeovirga]ANQ47930.1 ATP-binding cassette domain-containing protein [Flammeovirga sp. MY04]MBB3700907.1 ABC-type multidrug transport system ATPase subunit [Flammeovirga yaeyamensis]NMF38015.1 ATP-binding cassette domain-containing protein [Flammeovirga yaeyamensis]QWG00665.1 ATP-binding cassette domain-containing protein [Flammeovirga yaeyamensis]